MWSAQTLQLIAAACEEDLGQAGDITSALLPATEEVAVGRVVLREAGVVCGLALGPVICAAFAGRLGITCEFAAAPGPQRLWADGDQAAAGTCIATLSGPRATVLTIERTLLNFLSRLAGVATLTSRFVAAARQVNPHVQILDTRKTLPGWRELDKYAVRTGGGQNHRHGLHDAVLIKDNHLAGVSVAELAEWLAAQLALLRDRSRFPRPPDFVEVEVDTLEQFAAVCRVAGIDIVLLDNFSTAELREAVAQRDAAGLRGRVALEASGGVRLETVAEIAATGVDRISSGALTQAATGLDVALELSPTP
jgi:nicotinate-nucleotide pyrophosphorylase (carboxylating)